MRGIWIVLQRDLREVRQGLAIRIVAVLFALLTAGAVAAGGLALRGLAGEGAAGAVLRSLVGFLVYFATMAPFIAVIWAFGATLMIREKAAGNLETLLATPLRPVDIWLGKSLAIFLPAYALSATCALVAAAALNGTASLQQHTWILVLPPALLVTGLLVNPLFFFGLTALTVVLAFTHDPDVGIIPSFPIGFGLMVGVPLGAGLGAFDLAAWPFVLYDLGAAGLLWAAVLLLARSLTKERIVLSGP